MQENWKIDKNTVVDAFKKTQSEIESKQYESIEDFYSDFNSRLLEKPVKLKTFLSVKETLKNLKEKGYYLAILTGKEEKKIKSFKNKEYSKKKREILEKLLFNSGLDKYTDKMFIAYEHSTTKPQPKAFQVVLDHFDVNPSESFMIGDKEKDILASKIGISSILFDPKEKYKGETTPERRFKHFSELPEIIESYS